MPFFDYRCHKCGQMLETSSLTPPECPACRVPMRRVYTPNAICVEVSGAHRDLERQVITNAKDRITTNAKEAAPYSGAAS